jgi:Holliday junction resolvasome RuvABC DNA-binding subunit
MGVEFDSDDDEGREEAKRQVREELTEELQKLGFSSQEIADAMDHADIEEN